LRAATSGGVASRVPFCDEADRVSDAEADAALDRQDSPDIARFLDSFTLP